MHSSQVATWITSARFAPYLAEAEGDHPVAVELYVWNAQISAAVFETLHHVEVLLRNAVDAQFAPVDAAASPRDTWLEDPAILIEASRKRVRETIGRIAREEMLTLAGLIDPAASTWIRSVSRVELLLAKRPPQRSVGEP